MSDPPAPSWWDLYHKAMLELQWTPDQLGSLTLPQLVCLVNEDSPTATSAKDKESFLAMAARWERERNEWLGL